MRALLLLVTALAAFAARAEQGLFLELGVGYDSRVHEGESFPQSVIRLRYEAPNTRWWQPDVMEWDHHSNYLNGAPFNNEPEDTADQFSVIWRFPLWRKP